MSYVNDTDWNIFSRTEDIELGNGLLASEKDRAEHIMLVDLARNDVNRVCKPETVKVDELMKVEKFSHVIHLTSQISGQLRDGKTRYAPAAPAGSYLFSKLIQRPSAGLTHSDQSSQQARFRVLPRSRLSSLSERWNRNEGVYTPALLDVSISTRTNWIHVLRFGQ